MLRKKSSGQSAKKSKPSKKKSHGSLVKSLDGVFSQWVRYSHAIDGRVKCFTCDVEKDPKEMQAGHFQSRGKYSTRWDWQNVKPQCVGCNMFKQGEQFKFALNLDKLYGVGTAEKIMIRSNQMRKYSTVELEDMISKYKELLTDLKQV